MTQTLTDRQPLGLADKKLIAKQLIPMANDLAKKGTPEIAQGLTGDIEAAVKMYKALIAADGAACQIHGHYSTGHINALVARYAYKQAMDAHFGIDEMLVEFRRQLGWVGEAANA